MGDAVGRDNKNVQHIKVTVRSLERGSLVVQYEPGPGESLMRGTQTAHVEVPRGQSLDTTLVFARPVGFTTDWDIGNHDGRTLVRLFTNKRGH